MTAWKVKKGRIVVLPRANALAVLASARYVASTGDLNRLFPTMGAASASSTLARAIQDKVLKYRPNYFIDLHEGADYYSPTSGSVGQTCIYWPAGNAKAIASQIVNAENAVISASIAKFHLLQYPTPGSVARWVGQGLGVPAFIFETAAKVSLTTRISYQNRAVSTILRYLGMQ